MVIIIQTPGFKADEKLLKFVKKKLGKLDQVNDSILEGNVCLKLDKSDTQDNKICEIKLAIPGKDLFASKQSKTFEEAANNVLGALKRQLTDLKRDYKGSEVPKVNG